VILSCNGNIITRIYDLNFFHDSEKTVNLHILRKGEEMDVTVPTVSGEEGETDRFVLWAGALLHAPHRAVRQQAKTLHSLVYISARSRGSPAYQFGLMNTMYITHLNGKPTPGYSYLNVANG
jgi:pro-apoptotic serine protease NMA111